MGLDFRLDSLKATLCNTPYEKKKATLRQEMDCFMHLFLGQGFSQASPQDICRYLVWKDTTGKTPVHILSCAALLGQKPGLTCTCPTRLSAGYIATLIGQLKSLFRAEGFGSPWDSQLHRGNPVDSSLVRAYLKAVRQEQAKAHVTPKQARPLFLDKLELICMYLQRQLEQSNLSLRERFIFLRDQAFLKLQFLVGIGQVI